MRPRFLLPDARDNAAIATVRIEAGEALSFEGREMRTETVVPRGHRLCVRQIEAGEEILSWGYPFGYATRRIEPGEYLCNERMKNVLLLRDPQDYESGLDVNFADRDTTVEQAIPADPLLGANADAADAALEALSFDGYRRGDARGWGTRNDVVIIGLTSRVRGLVLEASRSLQGAARAFENVDALVPVAHTEGGGSAGMRNRKLLLRTLAGFAVNPNVGAAVFVDDPDASITNGDLLQYLQTMGPRYKQSTIRYFTAKEDPDLSLEALSSVVTPLLRRADRTRREPAPLSGLKLGLQCGGSDAFSGVTANPLLGAAVRMLLAGGATANLAETDELIGAEEHVLARLRERDLARQFIAKQNAFKAYAHRNGQSAEGNVSGGNLYRGLYNITLKSLGAGRKKDPRTSLEYVIGYGEAMDRPGYYFMDSPGNDLESIAGQVAAGANLILFTTGNGSITNFPFVPTIKIVTTNERFSLLETDMDFNAGALLDGADREETAERLVALTRRIASGEACKGEGTGQSQVQIWRDWWRDTPLSDETEAGAVREYSGIPIVAHSTNVEDASRPAALQSVESQRRRIVELLPTSLCSGQVAEQIAARINAELERKDLSGWEVVALPHTEGCGVSGGDAEEVFARTMLGYALHPLVSHTVFLEHGCEKTHNDFFRDQLRRRETSDTDFDWASIQRSGGIAAVSGIVERLVLEYVSDDSREAGAPALSGDAAVIGLATVPSLTAREREAAVDVIRHALAVGTSVVLGENDPLISSAAFCAAFGGPDFEPTIAYAEEVKRGGLHIMASARDDWLEIATGLGAVGSEVLVVFGDRRPAQPHRMIPVLQIGHGDREVPGRFDIDLDSSDSADLPGEVLGRIEAVRLGEYRPLTRPRADVGFQISRGLWGVSL